jgi:zinc protease
MIDALHNSLKSNGGWMALVSRAQSEPNKIDRRLKEEERLRSLTAADVQAMAQRYLDPASAVEIIVLPSGAQAPAQDGTIAFGGAEAAKPAG